MKLKVIRKVLIVLVALIILATNSMLSTANAVSIFLDDSSKDESSLVVGAGISSLNKVQRASYPPYVHNVDTGSVFKIYHHDGTSADYSNAGWCMDKGANLYGYGYSGGWATVSGEYDAYNTNNAREGSSGSIRWLLDNILRVGNGVSDDEKGFYRNNLQRIVGSNANIADYSEDRIFEIEQYVLWSFTNNVTGDSAISYPTSDPLFVALKNAAASHSDYSSDGSVNVNIDTNKANVNSNGVVGPFVVSNNKLMVLSAKLNNADTTIYTDEACTKTLSRYNEYNGNIYIKAGSTSNVNISFNYGGFDTTAYYYTTTGNPGNYRDQSFIMISREKKSQDVSFGNKNVNLEVHKKDMDGNDIGNIGTFKYWTTDDFGSGLVPTGNGTVMENHKSSITMAHGQTKYIWITETEAPKPYGLGYFEAPSGQTNFICIKVSVDASGNVTQSYPKEPQDGYNGYLKYIKDNDTTIYLQKDSEYFMGVSTSGDNIIVSVKDPVQSGNFRFQLIKEDNEGTKLANAEFEISITDEKGKVIYKTAEGKTEKTNVNGLINLYGLEIEDEGKTYTVKVHETKAPDGYIPGNDVTFTVESESNSSGYVLKPVAEKEISGAMVTITNSLVKVLVKNTEKVGSFNFQLIKEDNEGTKLEGAEFEISIVDEEGNVIYKTAEGKVEKTDSKGLINLQNLNIESAGKIYTVTIHETKAPNGYIAGKDVSFTVESKDNDEKTGYELKPVSQKEVSGAMVTVTNSLITVLVKNTQKVGSYTVNLVKVDKKGNIISKEVSKFTVNGQEIETENGYLNIVNSKEISKNGQTDVYKITETEAPKGYEKYSGEIALTVVGKETSKGYEVDTQNSKLLAGLEEVKPGKESTDGYVTWSITSNTITIKLQNRQFDLALRKFITGVTSVDGSRTDITTRVPVFKVDKDGKYVYEHTKEPVLVANQNVVEYTIRVYNEGEIAGYAKEIKDDIPEGLEFLPDDETNKEYRWIMLDEEGNETDKVSEAKYIVTDYLSKENEKTAEENLLKAFNEEDYEAGAIKEPDYKEVKVAFKVTMPNTSDEIIINQAQISDDSDEDGNEVTDKDSTPNEWIDGEDDQDIEKIKVQYFDLALRKWVTKAIVIEDGKEIVTETGHKAEDDPEAVVKVDLKKSKLNKVVVKFEYQIRVTNEGQIAGSVEEISDYIPEGLKFVAADNPEWEEVDGKVVTDQLAGQIMQPGESKEVTILLTWINREDNMGLKVNVAEISKDYNEYGSPDIDSTPNNKVPGEDDIDDAPVMLTVTTGEVVVYIGITIAVLGILAGGIIGIKKYVIK